MAFVTKSTNKQRAEESAPAMNEIGAAEPPEEPGDDDESDGAESGETDKSAKLPAQAGNTPPKPPRGGRSTAGLGFFEIYKKGQGYWTRMGTAIGILLIAALTAWNIREYIPTFLPSPDTRGMTAEMADAVSRHAETMHERIGIVSGIVVLIAIVVVGWWLTNKASNVDFLIATDSEMKKVNWTSRRDLIGSTKVVVLFMFVVTMFLFVVDIIFGELFHLAHVLQNGPFGGS